MSNQPSHVDREQQPSSHDPPPHSQQQHQNQHQSDAHPTTAPAVPTQVSSTPSQQPFEQPSVEQILDALKNVYHQTNHSLDGAAPSLNAVLQGPYFDEEALTQLTGGGPIDAYAVNMALRAFSLSLEPVSSSRARGEASHEQVAFLCFQHDRWFALRRVGLHWLNLNNVIGRPAQILPRHLSVSLSQLQEDGCEIYVVKGTLPACPADETKLFDNHFQWYLQGGIVQPPVYAEELEEMRRYGGYMCESEHCANAQQCTCEEFLDDEDDEFDEDELGYEEAFENDLQTAIAMSIADMQEKRLADRGEIQETKPLAIKTSTSPPTSIMSSEPVGADPGSLQLGKGEEKQDDQKG